MKKVSLLVFTLFCMGLLSSQNIQWQKSLGGSYSDNAKSIIQTTDGGYIVAGQTKSNDGDVSGNHSYYKWDYWIAKMDSAGTLQWQKCLGGSGHDYAQCIRQTFDGGYIVAGYTASNDGDVSGNHGGSDYWVVKLDSLGVLQWQKCLGGSSSERAYSIQQTSDTGYIIAGDANSLNGDVSGGHGYPDYWIVKLNSIGELQWQKCLGGSYYDYAKSIQQTTDLGYIIAGYTASNDGDVSGNNGYGTSMDYWIVKIDSIGTLQWQKCLGGTNDEHAYSIQQTNDEGFIIAGSTRSSNGDVSGRHGSEDYWIVKLDSVGELQWQKCLGGTMVDEAHSIQQTADTGYIIVGETYSNNYDVSGNHGMNDYWIVKLDSVGVLQWQKCLGGTVGDEANSVQQTTDGGYIIAGWSGSNDNDVSGNHGAADYWIVKLPEVVIITQSIGLYSGWNMMSMMATPNDISLLNMLQPLIDSNTLIKVINESGGFIQYVPGSGWMNTIGDMANTEGYYIKLTAIDTLRITGIRINAPFSIPLQTGWNLMGYPLQSTQNAITVLQPLIDSSSLTKVINESGGFIQNIPGFGWMNTIGNFGPGEGYYIKMGTDDTLVLNEPTSKAAQQQSFIYEGHYYQRNSTGNPYMPMHIVANFNDIEIEVGDELGVFINDICIGSAYISDPNSPVVTFLVTDDPTTNNIDGGVEGENMTFKLLHLGTEYELQCNNHNLHDLLYSPLETSFLTFSAVSLGTPENEETGFKVSKVIPNPFSGEAKIYVTCPDRGNLKVELLDLKGVVVKSLFNNDVNSGNIEVVIHGDGLTSGMYFVLVTYESDGRVEKVLRKVVVNS